MKRYEWREARPNALRTNAGRTAVTRHAEPVVEGHDGKRVANMHALCGHRPRSGWQATSADVKECTTCRNRVRQLAYVELTGPTPRKG